MDERIDATRRLCGFICGFEIGSASDLLLDRARTLLVDAFGVIVAAVDDEVAHAAGVLGEARPGGRITLAGLGRTDDAGFAAFYNGALAHALEFDDSTLNPVGHPSCVIVPALFALAEKTGASGHEMLEAYLVGLEIHSRLGQAEAGGWSAGGFWLPIGHVSLLGAAAACAKLLRLDADRTEHALGIAAHFCGGLSASNGSTAKPLGSGYSARAGLEAALLAKAGATGAAAVVERGQGFADAFLGPGADLAKALDHLGQPHHLEEIGIAIKRYPSCYATHWGVDALLLLIEAHDIKPADIASITLAHPASGAFCDNPHPTTPEEARFSHEYNLAAAVLDGLPGPRSYRPERMNQADIRTMIAKVATVNHPDDLPPPAAWAYEVRVATMDGRTFAKSVPRPLGHPRHPMSPADIEAKFASCVADVLSAEDSAAMLAAVRGIDGIPDMAPISARLDRIKTQRR